ncbi:MAG: ABC transporter ATP-binding protein, partial [Actinobacteria bacterium]|nr:ABC transporter ATP-binding protein [Actinomycetota bacterium]
ALQHRPTLLVLDEPPEGLDPVMKDRFVALLAEHGDAGGTIFLSSHILSEVEQATGRVGVVKAGRLVKVGPTSDLTGGRVRHCTLVLKRPLGDPSMLALPGVSDLDGEGATFRFDYRGDMEPLMRALGTLPVEEFLAEPEHLEEAFFEIYQGEGS